MLVLLLFLISFVNAERFILDGADWTFRSNNANYSYSGNAVVPGDIYTDLFKNGKINNPLYGSGDQDYKWVGRTSWTYQKIFTLPSNVINSNKIVLVFESLDTVVTVYLNGQQLFYSQNQFLPFYLNVTKYVNNNSNNLTLVFDSPVTYASNKYNAYQNKNKHDLPVDCTTPVGECHVNFIRKAQSSFSWDWGPSFATMGIAGSAYLEYLNDAAIYRVSPLITKSPVGFTDIEMFIFPAKIQFLFIFI